MSTYEAKQAYQDKDTAEDYDTRRFKHLRGKIGDYLDKRVILKALNKIANHRPLKIIDFPCGTARISSFLAADGLHVAGADISWSMMRAGISKVDALKDFIGFTQCDASQICFPDDSFDCVVCIRFIGHIPRSSRHFMFIEFNRISKYMVIEVSLKSKTVAFRKRVERVIRNKHTLPKRWDWKDFDLRALEKEFNDANYHILAMWPKLRFLSDSWFILLERNNRRI